MKKRKPKDKKADYLSAEEKALKAVSGRFVKPLSKEEGKFIKEHHLTEDEYRYRQACNWAILMGGELPDKKRFMADLAKKRQDARKALLSSGFAPSSSNKRKGRR